MLRRLRYVGLGALIAYFFDPSSGHRRRAVARERIAALRPGGSGLVEQAGPAATAEPTAVEPQAKPGKEGKGEEPQPDDVTLARNVETEIFRQTKVPKGQIDVNAENGKVVLRGEVEKPSLIKDLEKRTRKVQGVREVENLLHTPGSAMPAS